MSITRDVLLQYRPGTPRATTAAPFRKFERATNQPSVFLSHSHADRDLVVPAVNFLASQGVSVYVDWMDTTMPPVTNVATAQQLQLMILANRRFLLLATENSLASRWVPWELGYADGAKGRASIAVLAVRETALAEAPNEYVHLYQEVALSVNFEWYLFEPNATEGYVPLRQWLSL